MIASGAYDLFHMTTPAADAPTTSSTPDSEKVLLCPYCGQPQRGDVERCRSCGGLFEPLSQIATQIAMGPWYIRDKQQPFRPGCSYEVLMKMVEAGRIRPTSVMRGPTTRQFWQVARNVPGVAHFLGYCHNCNYHVKPTEPQCPSCGAAFKEPTDRDRLGLQFSTQEAAERAERDLAAAREAELTGKPTDVVIKPVVEGDAAGPRKSSGGRGTGGGEGGGVTSLAATMGSAATRAAEPVRAARGGDALLSEALGGLPEPATSKATATRPPGAAAGAGPPVHQALDFAPSEEAAAGVNFDDADEHAFDDHSPDPLAMTPLVWVLAGLNVIMLAVVTLLGALLWQG